MLLLKKLFGDESKRKFKALIPLIEQINKFEETIAVLPDEKLAEKTDEFKKRLSGGEQLDDLLPEAYAVVRETAKRQLGERHFDVQLFGGIILHQRSIAEMRTGEGKTLVATLPVYLNALTGDGVHVITVNDYLSRRDAIWMGQIYAFLGLSVGVINHDTSYLYDLEHTEDDSERDALGSFKIVHEFLRPCTRREAYEADVTYGTNNEYGFDYLRDNIEYDKKNLRQRGHVYAIVDEIDSILIDEARTPLIISAPAAESEQLYEQFTQVVRQLQKERDFTVDEKMRAIQMSDEGIERAEKLLGVENIYTEKGVKYVHHLETAVRAKALFERDREYVVRDGEVVIVDEFTGRLQPGRRWSEGLHQAIEAKEGVKVQRESRTFASVTFQNYFRMYDKLSGMTGTALTSAEEFYSVYGLEVFSAPTNKPIARTDRDDLIFQTEKGKFTAVARMVKELNGKGQPVLIGTVSIEKNEVLSDYLKREGIPHEVLNAKNHEREGEIIAQAGKKGKVTVATNMAGRGVDVKLGGNPATKEEYEEVKGIGGLFVIGTERHEARRIDNQLRGRTGRQGDPGETQFFVSLEDTLMRVFASETVKNMMGRFGIPEDEPIKNKLISRSLETAQKRIEGFNFDSRKHVLAFDNVLNHQRQVIYERRNKILCGTDEDIKETLASFVSENENLIRTVSEKQQLLGDEEFYKVVRRLFLQTIDMLWIEHLEVMDYVRSSVNLRAYGQRDPLIEYRKEGLKFFKDMEDSIDENIARLLPNIGAGAFAQEEQKLRETKAKAQLASGDAQKINENTSPSAIATGVRVGRKIGRNELVTITNGTETKEVKYKKAQPLIESAGWQLVESKT